MAVTTASSATSGFTGVADIDANTVRVTGVIGQDDPVEVEIAGITNPSAAGTVYARIVTFDTEAHADAYVSNPVEPAVNDGLVDNGSVALNISPTIGVSGAVLESMTFCVSKAAPTANCGGTTTPVLELGQDVGDGVIALTSAVSTGSIYTQLSTNASGGAIVSLKSNAVNCGGLKLQGSTDNNNCFIQPALNTGITTDEAKFGVKTTAPTGVGTNNGTLRPIGNYNNSTYALNGQANNLAGVTSTYGDQFIDSNDAPVNNMNMQLTFGAAINSSTPAGKYSADLSLIASGKF